MIALDAQVASVLARIEAFGAANDAQAVDRSAKMLNLELAAAELLYTLVVSTRRQRVLEIGTSNGYSAIWLASALRQTAGVPLTTIEFDADKIPHAQRNLAAAGVDRHVTILEGDATRICATLPGSFDCVFFDADRVSASAQLDLLLPKLAPDALLITDNVTSHPDEVAAYLAHVEALGQFDTLIVPVGKGLHIARRRQ